MSRHDAYPMTDEAAQRVSDLASEARRKDTARANACAEILLAEGFGPSDLVIVIVAGQPGSRVMPKWKGDVMPAHAVAVAKAAEHLHRVRGQAYAHDCIELCRLLGLRSAIAVFHAYESCSLPEGAEIVGTIEMTSGAVTAVTRSTESRTLRGPTRRVTYGGVDIGEPVSGDLVSVEAIKTGDRVITSRATPTTNEDDARLNAIGTVRGDVKLSDGRTLITVQHDEEFGGDTVLYNPRDLSPIPDVEFPSAEQLDRIGARYGCPRSDGEPNDSYRPRLQSVINVASKIAGHDEIDARAAQWAPDRDTSGMRADLAREELVGAGVDVDRWTKGDFVAHYDRVIAARELESFERSMEARRGKAFDYIDTIDTMDAIADAGLPGLLNHPDIPKNTRGAS